MATNTASFNHLSDPVIQKALALGFDDCGFSPAANLDEDAEKVEKWLADSFHGEMVYMEHNREKRYNPRKLVENTKTIVTVLFNYFPSERMVELDNYKIAKYAYGVDYHLVIRERLQQLVSFIEEYTGKMQTRVFTDSAPILDRAWAQKSGLGFIGKNTCLIHPKKGSFFFVGHIFLPVSIVKESIPVTDYCGTCTRCIDACPTGALTAAHRLDARKCISYLTIEHKGDLPEKLKPQFHNWIFGCDICQDVCPWNRFSTPHKELLFTLSDNLKAMRKKDWDHLSKEKFDQLFKKSAIKRTKYTGLHRNISFLSNKKK